MSSKLRTEGATAVAPSAHRTCTTSVVHVSTDGTPRLVAAPMARCCYLDRQRARRSRSANRLIARIGAVVLALGLLVVSAWWCASAFAEGDANMTSCANEALSGFRRSLPDCRAYEQVTPQSKGGQRLDEVRAIAADGSQMLVDSLVGFESIEGDSH